jgi:site-specific DNA-methyltransferase (cytosine-N4-specific)
VSIPVFINQPIEWVNKRKLRAKDSVNTVWWFSKTDFPKADVRKVLTPSSDRMKKLIEDPESFYTPKKRPSGHDISDAFGKDKVAQFLPTFSRYQIPRATRAICGYARNSALNAIRQDSRQTAFFIKMLTDEDDVVLDIFGGSNTTGFTAEALRQKWVCRKDGG